MLYDTKKKKKKNALDVWKCFKSSVICAINSIDSIFQLSLFSYGLSVQLIFYHQRYYFYYDSIHSSANLGQQSSYWETNGLVMILDILWDFYSFQATDLKEKRSLQFLPEFLMLCNLWLYWTILRHYSLICTRIHSNFHVTNFCYNPSFAAKEHH